MAYEHLVVVRRGHLIEAAKKHCLMSELSIHVYGMIRTTQCAKGANSRQSLKTSALHGYRVAFFILVKESREEHHSI